MVAVDKVSVNTSTTHHENNEVTAASAIIGMLCCFKRQTSFKGMLLAERISTKRHAGVAEMIAKQTCENADG
jgi:uncharacterized protein (UPF0332 family)